MVNIVLPAGALPEVESYRVAFLNSGISIKSFEPEAQAIFRLVNGKKTEETFMIINLNSKESDIAIISNGVIRFNSTLEFGGEKITSALAEMLQVSELEAEKIKKEYGFRHNMEHADIFKIISTAVTAVSSVGRATHLH
ncbi:pilus assembly protein PilM [Candidatus Nomurabacteria bacterium]|nr:pilus assembly protein PilM [Candidatus Nomurabacteria bacterium]